MKRYTFEIKNGVYKQPQYDCDGNFKVYKVYFCVIDLDDSQRYPFRIEASMFDDWKIRTNVRWAFGLPFPIPQDRIDLFDSIDGIGGNQPCGDDVGCAYSNTQLYN